MRPRSHGIDAAGLLGSVYALVWLLFLGIPAYDAVAKDGALAASAQLLGLAAFAAVYAWFWMRGRGDRRGIGTPVAFWTLLALALVLTVAANGRWIYMFIYVVVMAGAGFELRPAIAAVAGITALAALLALVPPADVVSVLVITFLVGMLGAMTIVVSRLITTNYDLEAARDRIAHLAAADERARISRDLHDLLGHTLSVIVLKAELASRLADADPKRAAAETHDIERVAREALKEVREAVSRYRQPSLAGELERARDALKTAGIEATIGEPAGTLPAEVEAVLAWAVREGVTNVVRHSAARICRVSLDCSARMADLEVADDGTAGVNGKAPRSGAGLSGLRERVAAQRGMMAAGPIEEGGFRLAVSVPLEAATR